jgi:hypothetical protein
VAHSRADRRGEPAGTELRIKNAHERVVGAGQRDTQSRAGHQDEPTSREGREICATSRSGSYDQGAGNVHDADDATNGVPATPAERGSRPAILVKPTQP